tara:strand:- start:273 stop:1403 length:1131 start_codon:yes stop_codon:yes gene_type:complete
MIFRYAIRRELLSTTCAVFAILFTIVITIILIRILGDAAGGKVATTDVGALVGFSAITNLPIIISLTSFISVLLVVARSYQDSEMAIWFSSGVSLIQWIKPIMSIGIILVAITALLSLWLAPWASDLSSKYKDRFRSREDISRISPGKFQESASGNRIFFVEGLSSNTRQIKNIFISQFEKGESSVVVAQEGTISLDEQGFKLLELRTGRRYDGTPNSINFQKMDFERYVLVVGNSMRQFSDKISARALSTKNLILNPVPANMSELLWRISLPIMCLLQMLLAIPLGFVNPRRGRSLNLMIALVFAITYSNSIGILKAAVGHGQISFMMGWWPLHLLAIIIITLLFFWRNNSNNRWHPIRLVIIYRNFKILKDYKK